MISLSIFSFSLLFFFDNNVLVWSIFTHIYMIIIVSNNIFDVSRIKLSLAFLHQFQYRYLNDSKVDFAFPKRFFEKRGSFDALYASFGIFQISLIS